MTITPLHMGNEQNDINLNLGDANTFCHVKKKKNNNNK